MPLLPARFTVTAIGPFEPGGMCQGCDGSLAAEELRPPKAGGENPGQEVKSGEIKRPASLVILALDVNGDGTLDAAEIANASISLAVLDANGDGQLTKDELKAPRTVRGSGSLKPANRVLDRDSSSRNDCTGRIRYGAGDGSGVGLGMDRWKYSWK